MKNQLLYQRRMLGILCALLAPLSILFGLLGDNLPKWYFSISATYYANSKILMIGLLFATGVFFLSYKGYDWKDRVLAIIQAISAFGIIIFPCSTEGIFGGVGLFGLYISVSHTIHCVFASLLFLAFGINITFLFTLGDTSNEQKKNRNLVYYICGITIFVFMIVQAITSTFNILPNVPTTLINEAIMLIAFSVAWLVKSELVLKDK